MAAVDPRVAQYADLIVNRSLGVKPGWEVLVHATPLARPMLEEVVRLIARNGAYALVRLGYIDSELLPLDSLWASEAPMELLSQTPPSEIRLREEVDAQILIWGAENTRGATLLSPERRVELRKSYLTFNQRRLGGDFPWVGCLYPTDAFAQDAGMPLAAYEDFVFGATLLDWDAEGARMRRYCDRFDAAETVRIVAPGTDLSFSLAGRAGVVDDGHYNMPGGEFFFSPLEDSAEGVIEYSEYPALYQGALCEGVRLEFRDGVVVDATARTNEEFLIKTLDTDDGARRVGELGIGCNPGIQRYSRTVLFDEKMDGTIHVAVGAGLGFAGGLNRSAVHWDMVKELRQGGRIELDGETVQENGAWAI